MDDLHVNGHLTTMVADDENADRATARLESGLQTRPQVGLVDDGQVLLDITGLGHSDDVATLHIEDAVLLEDWATHCLHDDARLRVSHGGRFLVQLLGEQVDTEVAVLTGGSRG